MRATAMKYGVENADHQFARFQAHALTHDRRCARWPAAWLQWCLHVRDFAPTAPATPKAPKAETIDKKLARLLAESDARQRLN